MSPNLKLFILIWDNGSVKIIIKYMWDTYSDLKYIVKVLGERIYIDVKSYRSIIQKQMSENNLELNTR